MRGFDHGLFVPLKLIFPEAIIPCEQLSLLSNLNPQQHIKIGQALSELRDQNILVIGSGSSFHSMNTLAQTRGEIEDENEQFQSWLIDTCTTRDITENEREREREKKTSAVDRCAMGQILHPRAEHL